MHVGVTAAFAALAERSNSLLDRHCPFSTTGVQALSALVFLLEYTYKSNYVADLEKLLSSPSVVMEVLHVSERVQQDIWNAVVMCLHGDS